MQGEKEHLCSQLQAPRKHHKPRIEKIRWVQGTEKQKINYILTLYEKKITTLHLFAFL